MSVPITRGLIVTATAVGGIAAGLSLDKSLVQLPAWRRIGPTGWAAYSRVADLGNGLVFYPFVGVVTLVADLAAVVAAWLDPLTPRPVAIACSTAAVLVVGHSLATSRAAPVMLAVGRRGDDEAALRGGARPLHTLAGGPGHAPGAGLLGEPVGAGPGLVSGRQSVRGEGVTLRKVRP